MDTHCMLCNNRFLIHNNKIRLWCNHTFHRECLNMWSSEEIQCPKCSNDIMDENKLFDKWVYFYPRSNTYTTGNNTITQNSQQNASTQTLIRNCLDGGVHCTQHEETQRLPPQELKKNKRSLVRQRSDMESPSQRSPDTVIINEEYSECDISDSGYTEDTDSRKASRFTGSFNNGS